MTVGIVGLGLIGGSFAKAYHEAGETVLACNRTEDTLRFAMLSGAVDGELTEENIGICDLVIIAVFPEAAEAFLKRMAPHIGKKPVVIDACGTKRKICSMCFPIAEEYGFTYLGGHPMAGREYSGFKYARDDLFDHASMILCGHGDDDPAVLQRARDFFMKLGFLRVQFTTPKTHDEMIAYTSQLAHVVSSAYVKCPLADKHRGFSAGSFADMTRVARLNEDMWTELFFDNREALLPVVEDLVQRVTEYRDALRDEDREGMRKLLREGRETKERLTD